jgi:hypothetical protein
MSKASRQVRIQQGGAVVALTKSATRELTSRSGTWAIEDGPSEILLMRRQEGSFADATMRLAGQVRVAGALCDVLALIGQSGWSGSLVVTDEAGTRTIEFEAGRVVAAASTVRLERFGEIVYRFGLATREQIENARDSAAITGTSLAEALAELEVVGDGDLAPARRRHVEEIYYASVRVRNGAFYFFDKRVLGHELPRPHPTALHLLMEGARRMDEMLVYRQHVPSEKHIPERAPGRPAPSGVLGEILACCNGKRAVSEVGRHMGMLDYEITQGMARLVRDGFVAMRMPRPRGAEQITEAFNVALVEVHRTCDRSAVGDDLREGLKRFVTGSPVLAALVSGAGPLDDGSFAPDRVARNLMARPSSEPVARLVKALHDYVGFGLFLGTSLVARDESVTLKLAVQEALGPLERASYSLAPASLAPPRRRSPALAKEPDVSGEFQITFQSTAPVRSAHPKAKSGAPPSSKGTSPPSSKSSSGRARSR